MKMDKDTHSEKSDTGLHPIDSGVVKPLVNSDQGSVVGKGPRVSITDSDASTTTTSWAWSSRWLDHVDRAGFRETICTYCEQRAELIEQLNALPRPPSPDEDRLTEDMLKLAAAFSQTKPMQLRCFRNIPESLLGLVNDDGLPTSPPEDE